ncbi:MAG: hypothetical protein KBF84_06575 [Candidatus Microthrix sp.]|jgi:hypothetical protein|nr:hypothetical protein [Candidatus Microthrix sp.]
MIGDVPSDSEIPGWWSANSTDEQADHSTLAPAPAGATTLGGPPAPSAPKKRWPYLLLIVVSLVVLTAGGTIIALNLGDDSTVTSTAEETPPSSSRKTSTTPPDSSDANPDVDATRVTLPERTTPGATAPRGATDGTSGTSSAGSPTPSTGGGDYTIGPLSFDVPSGFTATMVAELQDYGALRSEFQGPDGQELNVEVNVGKTSDEMSSAGEQVDSFRDQGRLIKEPYPTDVDGTATAVLPVRGSDGDYRSDHFLNFDGNGMAVMGIDPSSFDAADSLARNVIPTLES